MKEFKMRLLKSLVVLAVILTAAAGFSYSENDKFNSPLKLFKLDGWKSKYSRTKRYYQTGKLCFKIFFSQ